MTWANDLHSIHTFKDVLSSRVDREINDAHESHWQQTNVSSKQMLPCWLLLEVIDNGCVTASVEYRLPLIGAQAYNTGTLVHTVRPFHVLCDGDVSYAGLKSVS